MAATRTGVSVAVVGATGAVGEALLSVLSEREFPLGKLYALGSGKSVDDTVMFAERPLPVEAIADFDFSRCKIA
ncbi:MAG TPA: aspartate-semialdehyde dehydrogenase, partial [Spongiibacteraceae bacterium]